MPDWYSAVNAGRCRGGVLAGLLLSILIEKCITLCGESWMDLLSFMKALVDYRVGAGPAIAEC